MSEQPVDVLVVGAGAAGAAFAWSLSDTRMRIVCLEQGDWIKPTDYPSNRANWEMERFGAWGLSPNGRGRPEDYPVNDDDSPIKISNFNAVGGSTILYAAHFPRLHPSDFRVKTLDGVADDWPIDYETLAPYYDQNAVMMGVAGLAGDPAYPPKERAAAAGADGRRSARRWPTGFDELGWHWWPSDSAIATQEYQGRAPCINLGPCIMGCAQGAKASTDVTYWPAAVRRGVEVRTRCRVREITVDENGMADGATYYDADGALRHQKAEIVVVACNGVGTPRLLLNSASSRFPNGLANRSGLVGPEPDVPPVRDGHRRVPRRPGRVQGPHGLLHHQPGVLRDRPLARVPARLLLRDAARHGPGGHGPVRHVDGTGAVGRGPPRGLRGDQRPHGRHGGRSAKTCRRATTR